MNTLSFCNKWTRGKRVVLQSALLLCSSIVAWAATVSWNSTNSGNWGTNTNWNPNVVPGITDDVFFPNLPGIEDIQIDLGGLTRSAANLASNTVDTTLNQPFYHIANGTLNLAPNATMIAQGQAFFAFQIDGSCTLNLQGGANFIADTVNIRVGGAIVGNGPVSFIANDKAFLFLDGFNTYTGSTLISTINSASRIALNGNNNFSNGPVTVAKTGAALLTISPATLPNDIFLDGDLVVEPQIQNGISDTLTLNGHLTGPGGLIKIGASSLILNNTSTYLGGTVVNEGRILLGTNNAFIGSLALSNAPSALLDMNNFNLEISALNGGGPSGGNIALGSGLLTINGGGNYSGSIFGSGGLIKASSATLVLDGTSNFTGGTLVQAGTLIVNGFLGSNLVVDPIATLGGNGVIGGNVFNQGTLAPGNSVGLLTINGSYDQTSTGVFQLEIASLTSFDQLVVNGTSNLAGTLEIVPIDGFSLAYGKRYNGFLTAAGGLNGTFDTVIAPPGFRGRLFQTGTTIDVLVAPSSYTLVAQTQNQLNVAQALDSYISATSGDEEVVSIALDELSADQYPAAFDQIAPTYYESLAEINIEQANMRGQQMQMRFGAIRLGSRGFAMRGIEAPLLVEKSVNDHKQEKNILVQAPDNHWGIWVQGNGLFAENYSVNNVPAFRFGSGGFLTGVDYAWGEGLATGVYGGYQGTYARYDEGGRTTINSALFGLYATYDMPETGFYVDSLIGGGYSNYNVRRPIKFGTIDRTAASEPNGGELLTMLGIGYDWEIGNFTLGPTLTGQYTYVGIAPFSESGADSLNLRVNSQNANSLRTFLGGRVAYTWKASETFLIIPEGRLSWQHEYLEYPRTIQAGLNNGAGPLFNYETASPARDAVLASAGLVMQIGPHWNTNFYYTADFGRRDFVGHAISGSVRTEF